LPSLRATTAKSIAKSGDDWGAKGTGFLRDSASY
jgi:hypothetical protein